MLNNIKKYFIGRWDMVRIGSNNSVAIQANLFHLCASIPPCLTRYFYTDNRIRKATSFVGGFNYILFLKKVNGLYRIVPGVQSNNYWSSSTNANNTTNAWIVNMNNGNVNNDNKTNTNYVWPVRGGEI